MLPLTKRQREILDYLNDFIQQHGYAPSLEEIGRRFSLSSLATVHKHLSNLETKGLIRRKWNHSRAIEVTDDRRKAAAVPGGAASQARSASCGDSCPSSNASIRPSVCSRESAFCVGPI